MRKILTLYVLIAITTSLALELPPQRFLTKKFENVLGRRMAYVEVGKGDPIVFLHGVPTSSFVWRNIMPFLEKQGRLIAPDLIGFGDSDKLPPGDPLRYSFLQQANFLFGLLEKLGVKKKVTLVIHDWGSALGFLWAYQQRFNLEAIKGIAFMEAFVAPFTSNTRPELAAFFKSIRSELGEQLILEENMFIESIFPGGVLRNLTVEEMTEYRRPFSKSAEDRRPILTLARQVPIDGVPVNSAEVISVYSDWIRITQFPKLLFAANPGNVLTGNELELARTWKGVKVVSIRGLHDVQEDSPNEIGMAISNWLNKIE